MRKRLELMQFAFVVSSSLGYQIPNLFETTESFKGFEESLVMLREHGFDGVELNLSFDDERTLSRISETVKRSGLKIACIGTGLIYFRRKLSLTDPSKEKRVRAISILKGLMKFASKNDAPLVIGSVRGGNRVASSPAMLRLRQSLAECDISARKLKARIALEPLNRYETALLNTAQEAVAFIEDTRLTATGILLDTFHMNIEERSIEEALRREIARLVHFQIADSNRWPPSFGHLQIEKYLQILKELGYTGWVSAETLPKPNAIEAVRSTAKFLRAHDFIRKN